MIGGGATAKHRDEEAPPTPAPTAPLARLARNLPDIRYRHEGEGPPGGGGGKDPSNEAKESSRSPSLSKVLP